VKMGRQVLHDVPTRRGRRQPTRTGLAADTLQRAVVDNLAYLQARYPDIATTHDWYMALAYSVRDRMLARWVRTVQTCAAHDVKVACLSAEFLIGPQLGNNLVNLGIEASARAAMRVLGQDLDALLALEEEPGLGNGGLGRLAACYLDSLATLEVPAIGLDVRRRQGRELCLQTLDPPPRRWALLSSNSGSAAAASWPGRCSAARRSSSICCAATASDAASLSIATRRCLADSIRAAFATSCSAAACRC